MPRIVLKYILASLLLFNFLFANGVEPDKNEDQITDKSAIEESLPGDELEAEFASFEEEFSSEKKNIEETDVAIFENEYLNSFIDEYLPKDPLSGYNRFMTDVNDKIYINVFDPVTRGYAKVVPEAGRESIHNFFDNLFFPVRLANNLLQGKIQNSLDETARFIVNSTIGVFGLFDPAKDHFGIEAHDEDLGQTLGYYGIGPGFHIVLPVLGPSNLRDSLSMFGDGMISPVSTNSDVPYTITDKDKEVAAIILVEKVNEGSFKIGEYQNLKKDAIELYPFLRDIYEQRRAKMIKE